MLRKRCLHGMVQTPGVEQSKAQRYVGESRSGGCEVTPSASMLAQLLRRDEMSKTYLEIEGDAQGDIPALVINAEVGSVSVFEIRHW